MDSDSILASLVRIGTVTDVNNEKRLARIKFQDVDMTSGWLIVLKNQPYAPSYAGAQQTDFTGGGAGMAAYDSHAHGLTILPWMPKINDTVVALYIPIFNADGFIIGGI